jgi:uncharacterized membrane protein YqiK
MLERETAAANMQAEVVRSEQAVRIHEKTAEAHVASARGNADAACLAAEAEAKAIRLRGDAEADAARARGGAAAATYELGISALGEASYTAIQLATILGQAGLKLVPDVVLGDGRSNLSDVLLARMAVGTPNHPAELPALPAVTPTNGAHKS